MSYIDIWFVYSLVGVGGIIRSFTITSCEVGSHWRIFEQGSDMI